MRKGSAIVASLVGLTLLFTEAAEAQSLLQLLFGGPRTGSAQQQDPFAPVQPLNPMPRQDPAAGGNALYPEMVSRNRVVPAEFRKQRVIYPTDEAPGTIIVDTRRHFLFFILGNGQAIRYGVGVGREGFGWDGAVFVGNKQEWPAWHPPKEMIAREAKRGHHLPVRMEGGPGNPLGARALYLHTAKGKDTLFRIHGTSEPWTIGLNVSSGCIRMVNDDVIDLYNRAQIGAKVIVM